MLYVGLMYIHLFRMSSIDINETGKIMKKDCGSVGCRGKKKNRFLHGSGKDYFAGAGVFGAGAASGFRGGGVPEGVVGVASGCGGGGVPEGVAAGCSDFSLFLKYLCRKWIICISSRI